jgi:hypothetical protein
MTVAWYKDQFNKFGLELPHVMSNFSPSTQVLEWEGLEETSFTVGGVPDSQSRPGPLVAGLDTPASKATITAPSRGLMISIPLTSPTPPASSGFVGLTLGNPKDPLGLETEGPQGPLTLDTPRPSRGGGCPPTDPPGYGLHPMGFQSWDTLPLSPRIQQTPRPWGSRSRTTPTTTGLLRLAGLTESPKRAPQPAMQTAALQAMGFDQLQQIINTSVLNCLQSLSTETVPQVPDTGFQAPAAAWHGASPPQVTRNPGLQLQGIDGHGIPPTPRGGADPSHTNGCSSPSGGGSTNGTQYCPLQGLYGGNPPTNGVGWPFCPGSPERGHPRRHCRSSLWQAPMGTYLTRGTGWSADWCIQTATHPTLSRLPGLTF